VPRFNSEPELEGDDIRINGGEGNNLLIGGEGTDYLNGSAANEVSYGNSFERRAA
jgi:Ca2+-binding RTX toxin-like protein